MRRGCTHHSHLPGKLAPIVIGTMMDHPDTAWGDACYPVVDAAV